MKINWTTLLGSVFVLAAVGAGNVMSGANGKDDSSRSVTGGAKSGTTGSKCHVYVSFRYGYSFCIPPSWQPLDAQSDPGHIVNFNPKLRVHAVVIPPGGASLSVIGPLEGTLQDLDKWIESDVQYEQSRKTIKLCCRMGRPVTVVETTSSGTVVEPIMRGVNDYLSVEGRLLRATLSYWEDDPKRDAYLKTLHDTVLTLERRW